MRGGKAGVALIVSTDSNSKNSFLPDIVLTFIKYCFSDRNIDLPVVKIGNNIWTLE